MTWKLIVIAAIAASIYAYPRINEPYAIALAVCCLVVAGVSAWRGL